LKYIDLCVDVRDSLIDGRHLPSTEFTFLSTNHVAIVPAAEISLADPAVRILAPLFDQVWQAFGFERSFNFDEQGNWLGQG
jgi:hypothetical protein